MDYTNAYYDVFISYRHNGGQQVAKRLHKWLSEDEGYSTFYDEESIREGRWDKTLIRRVKQCKDFILIVDRHIFDNICNPGYSSDEDWVRHELSEALKMGDDVINIIPLILPKAKIPSNLPSDISGISKWQWVKIKTQYDLQDSFKEIKERLHCKPTLIQREYLNPISIKRLNDEYRMQLIREFAANGLLSIIEMVGDTTKIIFK